MARITVEDCIDKFPSRFELVLVASNRARKLHSGENPTVEKDNDKNTVIALREIADETLSIDDLKNDLIEEYQTNTFSEDDDLNEPDNKLESNEDEADVLISDDTVNTDENSQIDIQDIEEKNTDEEQVMEGDNFTDNETKDSVKNETNEAEEQLLEEKKENI